MVNGLAEKLRELRLKYKLSQRQVADRLNSSVSSISGYETGDKTPSVEQLLALSCLYNCSVDYLLGRQKEIFVAVEEHKNLLNYEQSQALARFINLIKQN